MPKTVKRIFVLIVGVALILIGIIGLALPFLQGFLFILIGVILLSLCSPTVHAWVKVRVKPYPNIHTTIERTEKWLTKIIGD